MRTVPGLGWAGLPDGELLRRAADRFDAFVTSDRNLAFRANVSGAAIGVVVLVAESDALAALVPLVPVLLAVLPTLGRGRVVRITRLDRPGAGKS